MHSEAQGSQALCALGQHLRKLSGYTCYMSIHCLRATMCPLTSLTEDSGGMNMSGIYSSAARLRCARYHSSMSIPHGVFQRLGVPRGQHVGHGGAPSDQVPGTQTLNESLAHGALLILCTRRTSMQMVSTREQSLYRHLVNQLGSVTCHADWQRLHLHS